MSKAPEAIINELSEQMKQWRRARSDMQLYFQELKRRDTLREEYSALSNAIETVMDIVKIGHRIESISKPQDFEEKLKGEQGKLIQQRFELMEIVT